MKFAYITDTHISPSAPGRRKGDYLGQVLTKWDWVAHWCADHNINTLIHGGDVFDRAVVPRATEQAVLDMAWAHYNDLGVTTFFNLGQHDLGVGVCATSGKSIHFLQFLPGGMCPPDTAYSIDNGYLLLIPNSLVDKYIDGTYRGGAERAVVIHGMLTPSPLPWPHILLSDLPPGPKLALSGDLHSGFDPNGTLYANPGALSRTFRHQSDFTRPIQFAVVDLDLDHRDMIRYVKLPDALVHPASEVYDEASVCVEEKRQELRQSVAEAVKRIKNANLETWATALENWKLTLTRDDELDALACLTIMCEKYETEGA
jgi:exonuclease SbcD